MAKRLTVEQAERLSMDDWLLLPAAEQDRIVAEYAGAPPPKRSYQESCGRGHPWTEESTGRDALGRRFCRICKKYYDRTRRVR